MSRKTKCDKAKQEYKPRCNHDSCWDKYFNNNIDRTKTARMIYLKVGKNAFLLTTGIKFTNQFIRFIQKFEKEKYGTISSIDTQ